MLHKGEINQLNVQLICVLFHFPFTFYVVAYIAESPRARFFPVVLSHPLERGDENEAVYFSIRWRSRLWTRWRYNLIWFIVALSVDCFFFFLFLCAFFWKRQNSGSNINHCKPTTRDHHRVKRAINFGELFNGHNRHSQHFNEILIRSVGVNWSRR